MTRGLRERSQNEYRDLTGPKVTRGVARAIAKFALRRNESDLRGPDDERVAREVSGDTLPSKTEDEGAFVLRRSAKMLRADETT